MSKPEIKFHLKLLYRVAFTKTELLVKDTYNFLINKCLIFLMNYHSKIWYRHDGVPCHCSAFSLFRTFQHLSFSHLSTQFNDYEHILEFLETTVDVSSPVSIYDDFNRTEFKQLTCLLSYHNFCTLITRNKEIIFLM